MFVLSRQTRGRKAVANSARTQGEPASKEQCNASQCYTEKHRVPGMPLPAEVRFVGDKGEDGSNRADRDDEAILLANAACEYQGRQAPYKHPRRPVERDSEFRGGPRVAPPLCDGKLKAEILRLKIRYIPSHRNASESEYASSR